MSAWITNLPWLPTFYEIREVKYLSRWSEDEKWSSPPYYFCRRERSPRGGGHTDLGLEPQASGASFHPLSTTVWLLSEGKMLWFSGPAIILPSSVWVPAQLGGHHLPCSQWLGALGPPLTQKYIQTPHGLRGEGRPLPTCSPPCAALSPVLHSPLQRHRPWRPFSFPSTRPEPLLSLKLSESLNLLYECTLFLRGLYFYELRSISSVA